MELLVADDNAARAARGTAAAEPSEPLEHDNILRGIS